MVCKKKKKKKKKKMSENFIDEGHLFYIQSPWYPNKQVAIFYR